MTLEKPIALIGGTGKAGKYILNELLARGYAVRMLARDAALVDVFHARLQVVEGDARSIQTLSVLLEPCQGLISTLGQTRGEPEPMFMEAMTRVIEVMNLYSIRRLVVVLGLNLEVPGDQKSAANLAATAWMKKHFAAFSAEKQKIVHLLDLQQQISWTVLRIPFLFVEDKRLGTVADCYDCPGDKVYGPDLADFAIDEFTAGSFLRQYPFVSSKSE